MFLRQLSLPVHCEKPIRYLGLSACRQPDAKKAVIRQQKMKYIDDLESNVAIF